MKKTINKLFLLLAISGLSLSLNAQMDNLINMSARWVGANARNASLQGGDIVNYNPAGLAFTEDGFYVSLSNQSLFRKPQHSFNLGSGEQSYEQDGPDFFLPSGYFAYKHNRWAISTAAFITGGGAAADYPEGSFNTNLIGMSMLPLVNASGASYTSINNQSLTGSSFYIAVPLNFSFAINEKLALSAGARYISAYNHTEAGLTFANSTVGASDTPVSIDYKNQASGIGGVFGIDFQATENLNFAVHYETKVNLEFEIQDNEGSMSLIPDGTKSNRDLPAVLYTGASYKVNNKLTTALDFNYYFQSSADWGNLTDPRDGSEADLSEIAGDCYAAALGFYYQLNDKLELMASGKYQHFAYSDKELYYTQMGLFETIKEDNLNLGMGVAYSFNENIEGIFSFGRTFWSDETINSILLPVDLAVNMTDKAWIVGLGIDFKF